jgi:predicted cobalt transporter CbtA
MAVVAGFVPTVVGVWERRASGKQVADYLKAGWTGLDTNNRFNLANLRQGLLPVVAGFIVHMFAGKLGINRAIARAGIPFIRI